MLLTLMSLAELLLFIMTLAELLLFIMALMELLLLCASNGMMMVTNYDVVNN
jgi:hypothetical protein